MTPKTVFLNKITIGRHIKKDDSFVTMTENTSRGQVEMERLV